MARFRQRFPGLEDPMARVQDDLDDGFSDAPPRSGKAHYGERRSSLSKRLRFEILRRDNHACRYCGATAPDAHLTVDHVVPVALGGTDEPTNLITACVDCNNGKSSVPADAPVVDSVAADALRWAKAMVRASDIAQQKRDILLGIETAVLDYWTGVEVRYRNETYADYLPADWYLSVHRWVAAGLTKGDLIEACHLTVYGRQKPASAAWKYFCGVCWRMVEARQTLARELIEADEVQ